MELVVRKGLEKFILFLFWGSFLMIAILSLMLFAAKMASEEDTKYNKIRSEVINELCQKQQYDFCKVKEVIYMENDDEIYK